METFAPYVTVLSINSFLKNNSSKIGPMKLIRNIFNMILVEFTRFSTGFAMELWVNEDIIDVIEIPIRFPKNISVKLTDT